MDDAGPDPTDPIDRAPPDRDRLSAALAAWPRHRFAVVDGAHFDDVTALFKRDRLFARSLFLDSADPEVGKAGPWLVALDQEPDATAKVVTLVGDTPAAAFWSCAAGEIVLYRHLRTLAMARIPVWAAEGRLTPPDDPTEAAASQPVFFRHYDPRVLGAFVPVLGAAQFARLLGPATEIAFVAPDHGGFRRVIADTTWPAPPPGMLSVTTEQIQRLTDRRLAPSQRRIADYLRDVFPEVAPKVPDRELLDFVRDADAEGRAIGIESEAGRKRWAYLVMASDGRVLRTPGALRFIQSGSASPDEQVRIIIDLIAGRLRSGSIKPDPAQW